MRSREDRIRLATLLGYKNPEKTGWSAIDRVIRSVASKGGDSPYILSSEKGFKGGWTERSIQQALKPGTNLHNRIVSKIATGTTIRAIWRPNLQEAGFEVSRFVRIRDKQSIKEGTKQILSEIAEKVGSNDGIVNIGIRGKNGGQGFTSFHHFSSIFTPADSIPAVTGEFEDFDTGFEAYGAQEGSIDAAFEDVDFEGWEIDEYIVQELEDHYDKY